MTLWEIIACADGHAKANGVEQETPAPSWEEHQAMLKRVNGIK